MKKGFKILIACIIGITVIIASVVLLIVSSINKLQSADYYSIGGENIASIKSVVGERKLKGISVAVENGLSTKKYKYQSDNVYEDLTEYADYLMAEEDFILTKHTLDDSQYFYAKESADSGMLLVVYLKEEGDSYYEILIEKGTGTLSIEQ